jgi:hypothetical protein
VRLSSQGSQFIFNLPSDFLPSEIIATYQPILEKNWIQYDNVIDYLNSTIRSVNFPGITIETPIQSIKRGKQIAYKPSKNVQDIVGHDITVKFASVDSDLNYWLLFDIFQKHYLDVEHLFINPFTITALDIHRDGIYEINFFQIILKNLAGNNFDYGQQKVTAKDFELTFYFNFYGIEFLLNKSKVLELGVVPQIIQKI